MGRYANVPQCKDPPGGTQPVPSPSYFRKNLEDILAVARKSGIKVLLSTVATNLKDCPPFASLHPRSFSTDQQNVWDGFYQAGVNFEAAGQFNEAIEQYRKAAQLDLPMLTFNIVLGRLTSGKRISRRPAKISNPPGIRRVLVSCRFRNQLQHNFPQSKQARRRDPPGCRAKVERSQPGGHDGQGTVL